MWPLRLSGKQRQGQAWENRALAFLEAKGMTLVEANFSCKSGEIDLILRDSGELVFVEVRQRACGSHGGAASSITPAKQRRVVKAAQTYLQRFERTPACRIDVIAIDGELLDWLPNAIQADA
ncbi:MAG: YraN family protein [Pseudomonadota bacterium]